MTEYNSGYYRFPRIHGDRIVFVAEDDLWEVPAAGGVARRLTTNLGTVTAPYFSPDGRWLAFTGTEEGPPEIYIMPSGGGPAERLTYLGGTTTRTAGWREDRIVFHSNTALPFRHPGRMYSVAQDGTGIDLLPYGPCNKIDFSGEMVVLGRKIGEPAAWKRYRGGMAGELLIDPDGSGDFRKLVHVNGNLASPMFVGERVFFLSDHEGVGNIYSCRPDGSELEKHTDHQEFYARNAATDGTRIVYHAGADLFVYDPEHGAATKVDIEFHSSSAQRNRKFVAAKEYLEDYSLSPDGDSLALTCRGKSYVMPCWEGAVLEQAGQDGARHRLSRFLNDGLRVVLCSDAGGEDHLEIHAVDSAPAPRILKVADIGRPTGIEVSPSDDAIVFSNHRNQLWHLWLDSEEAHRIDTDANALLADFSWSPDGKWVAYGISVNPRQSIIKVYSVAHRKSRTVTAPILFDFKPVFDPEGNYLYFLSARIFNPVYDSLHFDLGFPRGMCPYAVALRKDLPSPFVPEPKGFGDKQGNSKDDEGLAPPVEIDFEGIEDRVVRFPVEEGIYENLGAAKGRVFYTTLPVEGALGADLFSQTIPAKAALKVFNLETQEEKTLAEKVSTFKVSSNGNALAIRVSDRLRVVAADKDELDDEGKSKKGEKPGRQFGWIDLERPRVNVEPPKEWRQMLREAWRLQRDYFWTEDMSQVDWARILEKYLPLVERVSSRFEFADLVWEMQGELGTSHAYEMGGDYRPGREYHLGFLGADYRYAPDHDAWEIVRIVRGDTWDPENAPPLLRPGLNVSEGMLVVAVGGQRVNEATPPQKLLTNLAGAEVSVTIAEADGSAPRVITVKTLKTEDTLRYRAWVDTNREHVHNITEGRVGYLHIPNMMAPGYAEFHRTFLTELDHDGLIVDVRYNGGGHVSQLLLEKLARKRLGYSQARWLATEPYPGESPSGPMVCITNEHAGSDGDIVSHGFKLMKLGKLIGRRTWGGVIGVWPRNWLVDGALTTQPEFATWFKDVGWDIENYGAEPDIEVDIMPQDWARDKDPQLERAIEEVLKAIDENPPLKPDFSNRPDLRHP